MQLNRLRLYIATPLAVALLALLASGCGGEPTPTATNTPPPDAKRVDDATAGTVGGRVTYEGPCPRMRPSNWRATPPA